MVLYNLNTYVYVMGHSCVKCHRFPTMTIFLLFLRFYSLELLSTYSVGIVGMGPYHLLPLYLTYGSRDPRAVGMISRARNLRTFNFIAVMR